MELLYKDQDIIVCIKPAGTLSTDEPGGVPDLIREELKNPNAEIRTVHRLDRVVSGLMVVARSAAVASELSRQIRENEFQKEYLAIVYGAPDSSSGTMRDLLLRDKRERKTYIVDTPAKGVQEAILDYQVLNQTPNVSRVAITLRTGRTHQIRAQFSGHGMAIVGDKKYKAEAEACNIALWSHKIGFSHPVTGEKMLFVKEPPTIYPWTEV